MPAVNAFMQAASSLRPPRGGDQRVYAAYQRIHAGSGERPEQHYVTCLVQCVHVLQLAGLRVVGGRLELQGLLLYTPTKVQR